MNLKWYAWATLFILVLAITSGIDNNLFRGGVNGIVVVFAMIKGQQLGG